MKKVLSHMFSFIKHLFVRLRLVFTLSIGSDKENEDKHNCGKKEDFPRKD